MERIASVRRERRFAPLALVGPTALALLAIQAYPTLHSVYLSFHRIRGGRMEWVGAQQYLRLLSSSDFWASLGRTAVFASSYVAASVLLGLAVAALLRRPSRMSGFYLSVVFIPWVLSDVVAGTMWRWLFQKPYGLAQAALGPLLDGVAVLSHPVGAMTVVVAASVWRTLAFVVIILLGAMQSVPRETEEAAAMDGATGLRSFLRVTLPLIRPALLVTVLVSSIRGLNALGLILATTNGGPGSATATASVHLYRVAWQYGDFGNAAALAVALFAANALLSALYLRALKEKEA